MHRKKKKNIIISCLILIILVGLNGIVIVNGDTNTEQAGHGTLDSGTSCTVNPDKKSSARYTTANTSVGIRLALVDKNGNLIGRIVDIWNYDNFKQKDWPIYVVGGVQRLKKDVTRYTETGDSAFANNVYDLANKWSGKFYWTSTIAGSAEWKEAVEPILNKLNGARTFEGYASAIKSLSDKWETAKNNPETLRKIESGIKGIFGLASDYNINYQDTFLQIEPLATYESYYCNMQTGTESQQRLYYGTITELVERQSVHGVSSWGNKPWEGMYSKLGVGVLINVSKANDPANAKPTIYNSETDTNPSYDSFNSNPSTNGWGISHVWLGILSAGDCDTLIDILDKNQAKYATGSTEYNEAVKAILNNDKNYEIVDKDGKTHKINNPTQYDFLKYENYSKAEHYSYRAKCINYRLLPCEKVLDYVHKWGTGKNIPSQDYDDDVKEIREGKFVYWATDLTKDDKGNYNYYYYKIDKAYLDREGLKKEVYGDGLASCRVTLGTKTCPEALAIVHNNPDKFGAVGTAQYHDTIASIYNGTFSYKESVEDPANPGSMILQEIKIDRAYPEYNMLLKINYGSGSADCATKDEPTCSEELKPELDNECETGLNYYKDSLNEKYWLTCGTAYRFDGKEYSSENTGHEALDNPKGTPYATVDPAHVGSYEGIVGNKEYCKVYCYETVETVFPTKVTNVKAGQTFGWGINGGRDGVFGTIKIEKHCSNKKRTDAEGLSGDGYLYKKWENDYRANEKRLVDSYIRKGAAEEAKEQVVVISSGNCCLPSDYHPCSNGKGTCCTPTGARATAGATVSHYNSGDSNNWEKHVTQTVTARGSQSCAAISISAAEQNAINNAKENAQSQANAANASYTAAANREPKLLDQIRQCTNSIKYVYKTTINFNFEEPLNEEYKNPNTRQFKMNPASDESLLEREDSEDPTITTKNVNISTCQPITVYSYDCFSNRLASHCNPEAEKVLDCTQVTWDIKGEWTYKYPEEEFTWFSLKTDSTMMNLKEKNTMSEDDAYFYSIGFGLPTAFTLPTGTYKMAVAVSNLGDNGTVKIDNPYNQPDGHFGPGLNINAATKKGFDYTCTYEVENDMFGYDCRYENGVLIYDSPEYCDPEKDGDPKGKLVGIDVAYRLVGLLQDGDDITKAFPGKDGLGRTIGSNWSSLTGENGIEDVLQSTIYDKDRYGRPNLAMYEIFLDVGTIQKIRKNNQTFTGNEYTSFENVKCAQGADPNIKYCASDFISDLAAGIYGQKLFGTCLTEGDTQRRAEDVLANGCHGNDEFDIDLSDVSNWKR